MAARRPLPARRSETAGADRIGPINRFAANLYKGTRAFREKMCLQGMPLIYDRSDVPCRERY